MISLLCIVFSALKNGMDLPFEIGRALVAIPFIFMGVVFVPVCDKIFSEKISLTLVFHTLIFSMLMCTFTLLNYFLCDGANLLMYLDEYGNYFFSIPAAFFGVCMMIGITRIWVCYVPPDLTVGKIIKFLSVNSLLIYPIHLFGVDLGKYISTLIGVSFWGVKFLINLIFAIAMIAVFVPVINKYCPVLSGAKKGKQVIIDNR